MVAQQAGTMDYWKLRLASSIRWVTQDVREECLTAFQHMVTCGTPAQKWLQRLICTSFTDPKWLHQKLKSPGLLCHEIRDKNRWMFWLDLFQSYIGIAQNSEALCIQIQCRITIEHFSHLLIFTKGIIVQTIEAGWQKALERSGDERVFQISHHSRLAWNQRGCNLYSVLFQF